MLEQIQQEIFDALKLREDALNEIRKSNLSLVEKWQGFLSVILPIQIKVIKQHGYQGDQKGLTEFNEQYLQASAADAHLREINEGKWKFLLETAFGVTTSRTITLGEAKSLMNDLADATMSETFLASIDKALHKKESLIEKRKALIQHLMPLHMQVMEKHGFFGEEGYILGQRALMDHYHDQEVMKRAIDAQQALFQHIGVL